MRRAFFAPLAALVLASAASADPTPSLDLADRIEEDWVLVVDETASPDGPQVNTVMSPTADLSQPVVVLDVNYRHDPVYTPGGLQVLTYGRDGIIKSNTVTTNPLKLANETVKWTQRMVLSGGSVQYVISSVNSSTWGTFSDDVILASYTTTLASLAGYDPAASAKNSGGAWKTQGLKSLTLVQVRYYQGNTLLGTDSTSRQVDCTRPFTRP